MAAALELSGRYSWLQKSQSAVVIAAGVIAAVEDVLAVAAVAAPPTVDHQLYCLANFPALAWVLS